MENNLKEQIEEIVKKVKDDPKFMEEFKADPVKALEAVTGTDLPDNMIEPLISGIKAKMGAEDLGDVLGKLGGLFGK